MSLIDETNKIIELAQKNEGRTIDDISTKDLGACIKQYRAKTKDTKLHNLKAIAVEFKKVFKLDYAPSIIQVDNIIDNMPAEFTETNELIKLAELNDNDSFINDIKEIIQYVNAGYGKESNNKKRLSFWAAKYTATFNAVKAFSLQDMQNNSYTFKLTSDRLDPTIIDNMFDRACKSKKLSKQYKVSKTNNRHFIQK